MALPEQWRRWLRRRSHLQLVSVVMLPVTLLIAAVTWRLVAIERAKNIAAWQTRLESTSRLRRLLLAAWWSERLGDARAVAHSPTVAEALGGARAARRFASWLDTLARSYGYEAIVLLDARGRVVARGGHPVALGPRAVALSEMALRTGQTVRGFETLSDSQARLVFSAPVPVQGRRPGVAVTFVVDPRDRLFPLVAARLPGAATGETELLSREGEAVVLFSPLLRGPGDSAFVRRPVRDTSLAAAVAAQGTRRFGSFLDYSGAPVLAATEYDSLSQWGVVVKVDRAEVLAPVTRATRLFVALAVALALVIGGGLFVWLGRRRAREAEAVRRSEAYFRSLTENTLDIITVLNGDATIRYESPSVERAVGYRPEELLGRYVFEFVHPEDLERVLHQFQEGVAVPGATVVADLRFRHKDGSWRDLEGVGRNLLHDPVVAGVVFNSRDVTDRNRAAAALRQAQKLEAVGQLTAGIAHDFNNVLSVVLANAQLATESLPAGQQDLYRDLEDIRTAAQSGAAMIRKLMAFSREADLVIAPRELGPIVEETADLLRRLLPAQIAIETDLAAREAVARVDAGAVQQIVMNLATNARDAMPDGGALRLALEEVTLDERCRARFPWIQPGPHVSLSVRDTGIGMDQATKLRVFEPFFTTKPPGKGTGLGMAMVYGLMKQHGGCVEVESEPGHGTTVRINFPVVLEKEGPALRHPAIEQARGRGEMVLFVEDEEAMRRTGQRILERFGYRPLVASDGQEALELFATHETDIAVVLSDVEMPRITGPGLYRELRGRGNRVPFVFASGRATREVDVDLGSDPLIFFVSKPWTLEDLTRTVRAALDAV